MQELSTYCWLLVAVLPLRYITVWGDSPVLCDYAARDYDGLVTGFYRPRWEMFFNAIIKAFDEGQPFTGIDEDLYEFENRFAGVK